MRCLKESALPSRISGQRFRGYSSSWYSPHKNLFCAGSAKCEIGHFLAPDTFTPTRFRDTPPTGPPALFTLTVAIRTWRKSQRLTPLNRICIDPHAGRGAGMGCEFDPYGSRGPSNCTTRDSNSCLGVTNPALDLDRFAGFCDCVADLGGREADRLRSGHHFVDGRLSDVGAVARIRTH